MKKLRTHPPRFVALDNRAVDDVRLSVLDVGLLAVALRCPDGAEFTVSSVARKRKPGREALTGAMRNLVACGYVVKLKIQDAATGTWRTEFSVADVPFSGEDVGDMLADVVDARAIRVEPAWLDPRGPASVGLPAPAPRTAPTPHPGRVTGSRNSGATSGNAGSPQVGPGDGFPAVGEPIVGDPSANERTLHPQDEQDSSLSYGQGRDRDCPLDASPAPDERETPVPRRPPGLTPVPTTVHDSDQPAAAASGVGLPTARQAVGSVRAVGERVADAWAGARELRGFAVPVLGRKRVARAAATLLAAGTSEEVLLLAVADMARRPSWMDLERHLEHWSPPSAGPGPVATEAERYCGECDYGWIEGKNGRARKCRCWQRGPGR